MRKGIKNYTSDTPMDKSVTALQRLLVDKKCERILIDYENSALVAITFIIRTERGSHPVSLPARFDGVAHVMYGTKLAQLNDKQVSQVRRTAWKNILDWVDAQFALIEAEMVKTEEVFLPYIIMGNQTIFKHFENETLQLNPGK